jgi:peptide/nickel transport system substrate-binding protein
VYWSDGVRLNADDVVFTLGELRRAPEDAVYAQNMEYIVSYTRLDAQTLRINFSRPMGGYLHVLCFPVLPRHYYQSRPPADYSRGLPMHRDPVPLGNGLYEYNGFSGGVLTLAASETSFRGEPAIKRLEINIMRDISDDLAAFESRISDAYVSWGGRGDYFGRRAVYSGDFPTTYFDMLGFNFGTFGDRRLRQAVAYCVPYADILSEVYLERADISPAPVNPNSWLAQGQRFDAEFSPAKASQLINLVQLNGEMPQRTLLFLVNEESPERMAVAHMTAANMNALGLFTEVVALPFEAFAAALERGDYDLYVAGYMLSHAPDFGFFTQPHPDFSRLGILLGLAEAAVNQEGYRMFVQSALAEIHEEVLCVGIVFRTASLLLGGGFAGTPPIFGNEYYLMNEWYIIDRQ